MSLLPGATVIPDNWAAHHRPVAAQTMISACRIYRIAEGTPPARSPSA